MSPEIRVSAALVTDAAGRALVVRKRGTTMFVQPAGKPEAGESSTVALLRELALAPLSRDLLLPLVWD